MERKARVEKLYEQLNRLFGYYEANKNNVVQMPGIAKLNPVEARLIGLFEERESIGIKEVVRTLELPNSTVTSAVGRLMDKGLVLKLVDGNDRRAFVLVLTERGKDIIAYNKFLKMRFAEEVLSGLETDNEGQTLVKLLDKSVAFLANIHDDSVRSDYMNSLQKEYNAFGPWLIEVKDEEEIPQQFLSHRDKIMASDYCFKVPVKVDRHRLRPGMLMYNTVVCIYQDKLLILKASADSLTDYEIPYKEIRYITSSRELLDSHIIIGTDQKSFDIDYNAVSNDISCEVVMMLRERVFIDEAKIESSIHMDISDVPEETYRILTGGFTERETLTLLGYQPKTRVTRHYASAAQSLINSYKKYNLQDLLLLANDKELICIDSVHEVRTEEEPDYSYRHTIIRLTDIERIEYVDEPMLEGVKNLVIHASECSVAFKVGDGFDMTYLMRYLML